MATAEALTMNQPLTDFASAYQNSRFIADRVSAPIRVTAMSGTFQKRSRRDANAIVDDVIGTDGTANEIAYALSSDTYALQPRALKGFVNRAAQVAAVTALDPEQEMVAQLMQRVLLAHEKRVADVLTATGSYASANRLTAGVSSKPTVATKWSDWSAADPIGDIKVALRSLPSTGDDFERVMWISDVVFDALCSHPQILALKGTTSGVASAQELVSYFRGLDRIEVGEVTSDTANPGQAASYSRLWSSTACGIVLVPRSERGTQASIFAASFRHADGVVVRSWEEPGRGYGGSTGIQVEHMTQAAKVIQDDAGVIISGCL